MKDGKYKIVMAHTGYNGRTEDGPVVADFTLQNGIVYQASEVLKDGSKLPDLKEIVRTYGKSPYYNIKEDSKI